jgi:hypothetical protein
MFSTSQRIKVMEQWQQKTAEAMQKDIDRVVTNALIQRAHGDEYTLGMLWRIVNTPMRDGVTTYQAELRAALIAAGATE